MHRKLARRLQLMEKFLNRLAKIVKVKPIYSMGRFATRKVKFAIIGLATLIHLGCAPSTPEAMREAPGKTRTFDVPVDYEKVYESEQQGFLHCLTGMYYTFSFGIRPRIDRVNKTATIPLIHFPVKDVWALVDIRATDHGTTVTADTTNHPLMADFPEIAEVWANGGTRCPKYSLTTQQFPFSQ
jgi:hypothetical protein